jgi:hypothetical protein
MPTLTGGCHCGKVRFEVDVEALAALDCNCSICTKKGFLHLIVPQDHFRLVAGRDALVTYTFNTHVAKHHFCGTCGIHAFYVPRSHPDQVDVNVRALDDDEIRARFVITPFNGREWEANVDAIR